MIITVKNLQQQTFTVEFDPEKSVLELKEKIFTERGPEYVVEKQKLIYAGVILDDERTIASYNVDEKKFVVVMLKRDLGGTFTKPDDSFASTSRFGSAATSDLESKVDSDLKRDTSSKATKMVGFGENKIAVKSGTGSDEDTKSIGSSGSDNDGGGAALGPVASNTGSLGSASSETSHSTYSRSDLAGVFSNTSLQSRAESNLLMGEEYNRTVSSMIEMGYCREMVERAMTASFNNPERAVEYLISGIPETENGFNNASSTAAGECAIPHVTDINVEGDVNRNGGDANQNQNADGDSAANRGGDGAGYEGAGGEGSTATRAGFGDEQPTVEGGAPFGEDPLEFLRNQPEFLQMRALVYQNPELLHAVLRQIAQTNPALLQLISENQDAFLNMLNQPLEGPPSPQYPRRMTPGRRAQLVAAALSASGGDSIYVRALDTAPGAHGDGPPPPRRPEGGGDAGADAIPQNILIPPPDRAAERRAAAADTFMRERAAAAAAVAALTPAPAAVDRDAGGSGEGGGNGCPPNENVQTTGNIGAEDGLTSFRLTQQDQAAVERLKALGFPEAFVLQAFLACDKDEQLAANFLISSSFDD